MPGTFSTGHDESHLSFSPDGATAYFLRNSPDFRHWTVLASRRRGTGWAPPAIAPFSGEYDDGDVFVVADGSMLYFISDRPPAGHGPPQDNTDIWTYALRGPHAGEMRRVGELSGPGDEWHPTLAADGSVYFGSERAGGFGGSDIWRARWLGTAFAPPENLGPAINSEGDEIEPLVEPGQHWLVVAARRRPPAAGSYDLYVSYRCQDAWGPLQPLVGGANSPDWDFAPSLSPDGRTLFFSSNRPVPARRPGERIRSVGALTRLLDRPGNGLRDLYSMPLEAALPERAACGESTPADQSR